jgi:hypothetical protein
MSQSTTAAADAALDEAGPIGYLIVRFGSGRAPGHAFHLLLELADRDLVRVLDMEFVTKDTAGAVALADPVEIVTVAGGELPAFKGASSGLLDAEDVALVGGLLDPGGMAAVVVYENVWVAAMSAALRADGAGVVAAGPLSLDDLNAVLAAD